MQQVVDELVEDGREAEVVISSRGVEEAVGLPFFMRRTWEVEEHDSQVLEQLGLVAPEVEVLIETVEDVVQHEDVGHSLQKAYFGSSR